VKRAKVLLLNLAVIGCWNTSKMVAQSYHKASINKIASGFFDILIGCLGTRI